MRSSTVYYTYCHSRIKILGNIMSSLPCIVQYTIILLHSHDHVVMYTCNRHNRSPRMVLLSTNGYNSYCKHSAVLK